MTIVDPSWGGYHTNADPTQAPAAGEPRVYWGYKYGTNMRLLGHDNLEVTGSLIPGGTAQIQIEAKPGDFAVILFALRTGDQAFAPFTGPLRLSPASILPPTISGNTGATGVQTTVLPIPANPSLRGATMYLQGQHDPNFSLGATFTPLEVLMIK